MGLDPAFAECHHPWCGKGVVDEVNGDLADAPDTGIEGAQGKVGEDRAVIGIGDHLVVAERLPEGVHGPNRWISAIVRSVQDG